MPAMPPRCVKPKHDYQDRHCRRLKKSYCKSRKRWSPERHRSQREDQIVKATKTYTNYCIGSGGGKYPAFQNCDLATSHEQNVQRLSHSNNHAANCVPFRCLYDSIRDILVASVAKSSPLPTRSDAIGRRYPKHQSRRSQRTRDQNGVNNWMGFERIVRQKPNGSTQ